MCLCLRGTKMVCLIVTYALCLCCGRMMLQSSSTIDSLVVAWETHRVVAHSRRPMLARRSLVMTCADLVAVLFLCSAQQERPTAWSSACSPYCLSCLISPNITISVPTFLVPCLCAVAILLCLITDKVSAFSLCVPDPTTPLTILLYHRTCDLTQDSSARQSCRCGQVWLPKWGALCLLECNGQAWIVYIDGHVSRQKTACPCIPLMHACCLYQRRGVVPVSSVVSSSCRPLQPPQSIEHDDLVEAPVPAVPLPYVSSSSFRPLEKSLLLKNRVLLDVDPVSVSPVDGALCSRSTLMDLMLRGGRGRNQPSRIFLRSNLFWQTHLKSMNLFCPDLLRVYAAFAVAAFDWRGYTLQRWWKHSVGAWVQPPCLTSLFHKDIVVKCPLWATRARYWTAGSAARGCGKNLALDPFRDMFLDLLAEFPHLGTGDRETSFHVQQGSSHAGRLDQLLPTAEMLSGPCLMGRLRAKPSQRHPLRLTCLLALDLLQSTRTSALHCCSKIWLLHGGGRRQSTSIQLAWPRGLWSPSLRPGCGHVLFCSHCGLSLVAESHDCSVEDSLVRLRCWSMGRSFVSLVAAPECWLCTQDGAISNGKILLGMIFMVVIGLQVGLFASVLHRLWPSGVSQTLRPVQPQYPATRRGIGDWWNTAGSRACHELLRSAFVSTGGPWKKEVHLWWAQESRSWPAEFVGDFHNSIGGHQKFVIPQSRYTNQGGHWWCRCALCCAECHHCVPLRMMLAFLADLQVPLRFFLRYVVSCPPH